MAIASPTLNTIPSTKHTTHKEPVLTMSSSQTPEQVAEQALRDKADLEAQVKYLQTQLGQLLNERKKWMHGSSSPRIEEAPIRHREDERMHGYASSEEEVSMRSPWPRREAHLDFKVDIPELRDNSIQTTSLIGFKLWSESLNTKTSRTTRR